jgi:hypothetical protein
LSHPSDGPRIKIQRAKKHIYELDAEVRAFLGTNPYRVFTEDEADTGDKVWRVKVSKQPPPRWSAIVGDAVHNLRSSLDLLVNQLVLANGHDATDETAFPIGWTGKDYETKAARITKGISDTAKDMIAALKPYKGGNDALWRLHRLDIADKHRLLLAVGATHRNVILPSPAVGGMPAGAMSIALGVADRQFPLKDRTEIFRVAKAARREGDQDYDDLKFTFEVALNEPGVIEGEAALPALHELSDLAQGIVAAFDPLLS